jgi:hypothetical protein
MTKDRLTPLQYLAVGLLFTGEKSGREIREAIAQRGTRLDRAGLCRLMQRLVWQKSAVVRREERVIGGRVSRECYYRATSQGVERWQRTRAFFTALPEAPPDFEPAPFVRDKAADEELQREFERIVFARIGHAVVMAGGRQ